MKALLALAVLPGFLLAAPPPLVGDNNKTRANELKALLNKEKPAFEQRERNRKDLLSELDHLNSEQNQVRRRIADIGSSQSEMTMALDNLEIEVRKQEEMEKLQKRRLLLLLNVVYHIKRDGVLRFVIQGENLSTLAGRARILYRTLRSHTEMTKQLKERSDRLAETQLKLNQAKTDQQRLLTELHDQENLLSGFLKKRHAMLGQLNQKQNSYQAMAREYRNISKHLTALFDNFESIRNSPTVQYPNRGTLALPVDGGRVVQGFGKSIHEKFGTVVYHKGVEIEAEHNSPVHAVMPGMVEYDGWVRGLGNVLIVHHGGGFYSLSAHLFRALKKKGDSVERGEPIGLVGDTGNNERPSLYFELRENGKAVDPLVYFSRDSLRALN